MRLVIGFVLLQILRLLMELKCGLVLFRIAALHTLRSFSRLFKLPISAICHSSLHDLVTASSFAKVKPNVIFRL